MSRTRYRKSWISKCRQSRPLTDSTNVAVATPIDRCSLVRRHEAEVVGIEPQVLVEPEVQLEEVLHHLGRHVAWHDRRVAERDDRQLSICGAGAARQEGDEPRVEGERALRRQLAELGGAGLAGERAGDLEVADVVR